MTKLDETKILARANRLYAEAKVGDFLHFMSTEDRPKIKSNQLLALLTALVEAINDEDEPKYERDAIDL